MSLTRHFVFLKGEHFTVLMNSEQEYICTEPTSFRFFKTSLKMDWQTTPEPKHDFPSFANKSLDECSRFNVSRLLRKSLLSFQCAAAANIWMTPFWVPSKACVGKPGDPAMAFHRHLLMNLDKNGLVFEGVCRSTFYNSFCRSSLVHLDSDFTNIEKL